MNVSYIQAAARADGLVFLGTTPNSTLICPPNDYVVALVIAPGVDYHWYRHNPNGTWSGKPGSGPATNLDASGAIITDPQKANRNFGFANYSIWGGYFAAPPGITVSP